MHALDRTLSGGRPARGSFAEAAEIDEFVRVLAAFERGEIGPDEWRAFRLVRGTYGQRQTADAQMLRVKIPQGVLDAEQLEALAEVAERWSRGFGHVTTRQNLQFHFVRLHDAEPAMRRLAEAGLTTREACGNSVRNVTACPYAGVADDEVFDVTPYAEALTRYFLRHPLSSRLPRKFKVAFEGCPVDHAFAAINDIGWRAVVRDEDGRTVRGFRVLAGGGTSILCTSAGVLFEFVPVEETLRVAEAIVRVFHRLGDYAHKQRNRMKFLIRSLGFEAWKAEVERELEAVRAEGGASLPFDPGNPPVESPPRRQTDPPTPGILAARTDASAVRGPGLRPRSLPVLDAAWEDRRRWVETNVRPQRQPGYATAVVRLRLGDITAAQLRAASELARAYGDGTVRTTHDQNLLLRWVRDGDLPDLYQRLAACGLGEAGAHTAADVTSCPGAESCRLAVTQSRGLADLVAAQLESRPDLVAAAGDLEVKISGCPNGCGQHHVAGIGFQGSVRRLGDRVVPQYFLMLGGQAGPQGATFGRLSAKVPARRIPDAIERLVLLYRDERLPGERAADFFRRLPAERVKALLADLEALTPASAQPSDYVDLGEETAFRPDVMEGECSA
ncbi:MAG TPA: nitrite/sulfite reductase [Vicinamibacteria bacterium]|nr:nitrite/sulfite reductase [Vicinamibacteria bacterium]